MPSIRTGKIKYVFVFIFLVLVSACFPVSIPFSKFQPLSVSYAVEINIISWNCPDMYLWQSFLQKKLKNMQKNILFHKKTKQIKAQFQLLWILASYILKMAGYWNWQWLIGQLIASPVTNMKIIGWFIFENFGKKKKKTFIVSYIHGFKR